VSRGMPDKRYPLMLEGVTAGTSETNSLMLTMMQLQLLNRVENADRRMAPKESRLRRPWTPRRP
jgi:hypothetical protein